jgi:hypothetical protein
VEAVLVDLVPALRKRQVLEPVLGALSELEAEPFRSQLLQEQAQRQAP